MSFIRHFSCTLVVLVITAVVCDVAAAEPADAGMTTVRQRIVADLIGTPVDPDSIAKDLEQLKADGSFSDVDYKDQGYVTWKANYHLVRVLRWAQALATPALRSQLPPDLRTKTLRALTWWMDNDLQNPNWWYNIIDVPQLLGESMLLIRSDLSQTQLERGVRIVQRSTWGEGNDRWQTGMNRLWVAANRINLGLLLNDTATVREAFQKSWAEMNTTSKEGIQPDMSFHQHGGGRVLYSGGYGADFADFATHLVYTARETGFAAPADKVELLSEYLVSGQQFMVRGQHWDWGVVGREIARPTRSDQVLATAADRMASLHTSHERELSAMAERIRGDAKASPVTGVRAFYDSDITTQVRAGSYVSFRGFSQRIYNTEHANEENNLGTYLGDGATCIMVTGNEYQDIFPVWDWHRIPGTTVEQGAPLIADTVNQLGVTAFVGGVSDGQHGLAVLDLKRPTLSARKAAFFFDREVVLLGTGITSSSQSPTFTSINQVRLNGSVLTSANATPLPPGQHLATHLQWIYHDSVGYVFPQSPAVEVSTEAQSGAWSDIGSGARQKLTQSVFSAWLSHGTAPSNATYQYIVLPGTTAEETSRFLGHSPIHILDNNRNHQSVEHAGLGVVMAAFYEPGKVKDRSGLEITVDQPCLVMLAKTGSGTKLTVANPAHQPVHLTVTYGATRTQLDLPTDGSGISTDL
jgi:chondroitin AC lyase